jgi:ubiquinone/menaquinone biosynthesis C-methylase UbiE
LFFVFKAMIARLYTRLLRWAFARFYREFAWTYDTVAALVSRGLWSRWIEAAAPQLQGTLVLELGCGTGYLQRALQRNGIAAIGLDASPYMLRLAQRKLDRAGGRARLAQSYAQRLPFPGHTFSDVVATFPAEYILDPATFAEIWRVLRPGGQVVLIDAAYFTRRDTYSAAVDVAYRVTQQVRAEDPRPRLLEAAGFAVRESWIDVGPSRVQILRGLKPAAPQ